MHEVVVALSAAWGLAAGLAAVTVPWRRWLDEPPPAGETYLGAGARPTAGDLLPALGGLLGALLAQQGPARPELAVWLLLLPVGLLLARVDLAVRRLPDVLTLPAAAGTAVLLGGAALLPGHAGSWPRALLGGLVLGAAYFALMLIRPDGMGFGDVKLAPTLGLVLGWYGWAPLFYGASLAFVLAALAGAPSLLARRRTTLPFGPFMLAGALAVLVLAGA